MKIEYERKVICLIGTVLKGRYCVMERIGRGGGGSLYLVRDMELGVYRAVKEIPAAGKREAKLMRLLEHPAIPRIVDYAEDREFCYLIMEYIQGQSLGEMLRSGKIFSMREILHLGIEAAQVMEYLHSRKPAVCYGDLKPDNLMLCETGHLYLVDFGSAMSDYGNTGQSLEGTRGYAAPEQYQGRISPASDIYALGKTLRVLARRKKRLLLIYPEFAWFLFRCTGKQEKYRYRDMGTVKKILQKLEIRYRAVTWRKRFLEAFGTGFLICVIALAAIVLRQEDFESAVSEVTDLYYETENYPKDSEVRKTSCQIAEKKLQKLREVCREKMKQRRIELLLAWNAELKGEPERAALYYENLLLYDEKFRDAYGEYGMFLIRKSQKDASRKLWRNYQSMEKKDVLEGEKGRNLLLWEEINEKDKEEKKS